MLNIAVIGCGVIGPVHAAAVRLDTAATVRWGCDLDLGKCSRVAAERSTHDATEVFADPLVDLVCVCVQHPAHADLACAALAAGKHVLCEKPLASVPGDIYRIVRAAAARPRQVASGIFQHRYAPLPRRLRQLVADGAFGAIQQLDVSFACTRTAAYYASAAWRGRRIEEGGGVALNQGIHSFDLGLWLACATPLSVFGSVRRRRMDCIECEDVFDATVVCSGGLTARLRADNDGQAGWRQRIVLRGTRGSIILGDGHRLTMIEHTSIAMRKELEALDAANLDGLPLGGGKDVYGYNHALQMADVIDAIRCGRQPMVTVADAVLANMVILAGYRSFAIGAPVALPLDVDSYSYPVLPLESA